MTSYQWGMAEGINKDILECIFFLLFGDPKLPQLALK
jgi:hypothetical protein